MLTVRETSVSRHHGGPIEGPPETPRTSENVGTVGMHGLTRETSHLGAAEHAAAALQLVAGTQRSGKKFSDEK